MGITCTSSTRIVPRSGVMNCTRLRFVLALTALTTCTALRLASPVARRHVVAAAVPALLASRASAEPPTVPARTPPTNFLLLPEGRPYFNYLQNAGQLASHLKWYSQGVDSSVGPRLDGEITRFAAIYAPPPGALIEAGATPGLAELITAYDALANHFLLNGGDTLTPLPDAVASTVRRNAVTAQKLIKRAQDARGKWPACGPEGRALGSRDTDCSTMRVM